ncbi:OmpA family protein [Acinetobacter sp. S40]|uniref:OmpA family protein n=1 Tax=Acinetobacter sp. S40 TaxID=2767434 RepID=UPI00190A7CC6|nr:OmpA family protein [Acinetobacter sp. S40]MBJ9986763.1 OmpA family protein [Acinetobacter sp. S40]
MLKLSLLSIATLGLIGCASNPYSKPSDLKFQENKQGNTQIINVKRDDKLCSKDTQNEQNCPIDFYIDSIKAGHFYINNTAKYHLKPEIYNFKVKNCVSGSECKTCDVDLSPDHLKDHNFILSVDDVGKPFILNGGQPLICTEKKQTPQNIVVPVEQTISVNLAADTLFKFNGFSLNDLLPKGRQEVLNVASQISNKFVSVSHIKLIGHTDRLGSESYNQQLGQNRAETVRNLLAQNGVPVNLISTTSEGKNQPVTDGCPTVKSREALKACLQADRRVTVEITGISK